MSKALYFTPEGDEAMQVIIVKSGWTSPQMYHVLVEKGEDTQYQALLLNKKEIHEQIGIIFKDVDFDDDILKDGIPILPHTIEYLPKDESGKPMLHN